MQLNETGNVVWRSMAMHPPNTFFLFLLMIKLTTKNVAHASSTVTTNVLWTENFESSTSYFWCSVFIRLGVHQRNQTKKFSAFSSFRYYFFFWQSRHTETVQTNQKYYYVCALHNNSVPFIEKYIRWTTNAAKERRRNIFVLLTGKGAKREKH